MDSNNNTEPNDDDDDDDVPRIYRIITEKWDYVVKSPRSQNLYQ
jgi:hypothetical protein